MSLAAGAGGDGPGEPREPGEAFVRGPVQSHGRPPERQHLELSLVRVFKQLHRDPPPAPQSVVTAGQREATGHEADVRAVRHLMSARPAQHQRLSAHAPLRLGTACLPGLEPWMNQEEEYDEMVRSRDTGEKSFETLLQVIQR